MAQEQLQKQKSLLEQESVKQQAVAKEMNRDLLVQREYEVHQTLQPNLQLLGKMGLLQLDSPSVSLRANAVNEELLQERESALQRQESGKKKLRDQEKDAAARAAHAQRLHEVTPSPALERALKKGQGTAEAAEGNRKLGACGEYDARK